MRKVFRSCSLLAGVAGLALASSAANAQSAEADSNADDESEIVVTGTLLRGIAPVGTNVVGMDAGEIAASGAVTTNQLLAKIPQVSSAFNSVPTLPTSDPGVSVVFPNIRNVPAVSSATTLVLLDGHRVGGSGGFPNVDPDIIPSVVIQSVDVIPDGGSATYGSDAVGGVINFITRKRFDGMEVNARYGFGKNYQTLDASALVGRDWGSGSGYIAYNYAENEELQGKDRSYFSRGAADNGQCAPGTVEINRAGTITTYALPDRTPGARSSCDPSDEFTIFPKLVRHSVFGNLTQELASGVDFNLTAFYSRRESTSHTDLNEGGFSGKITTANPYYVPIAPNDPGTQLVRFSFADIFSNQRLNRLQQYGITPSITADLGSGWRLNALSSIGRSHVEFFEPQIDSGAVNAGLVGTTIATALNPYNLAATSAPLLRGMDVLQVSDYRQEFENVRLIVDGSPMSLPAGDVKIAVGAEYTHEKIINSFKGAFNASARGGRNAKAVFGELAVPVFGPDNAKGGFQSLILSASGRYDDYSTTGGTFNPKLGFTWKPVDRVTVRGNWGKSFNAPPLGDTSVAADTRAILLPNNPGIFADPFDTTTRRLRERPIIILAGGNPNLKPQKARTWSLGLDVEPVDGLKLSATYYNIKMTNQITIVPIFNSTQAYRPVYGQWVTKFPTLAQAQALVGNLPLAGGFTSVSSWFTGATDPDNPGQTLAPAVILDARRQNLGVYKQNGIDFNVSYNSATSFGSISASIGGTYTLNRKLAAVAGDPFDDLLKSPGLSRYSLLTSLGGQVGNFGATVNWSHSGGYDLRPAVGAQNQVSAFNTVDLYLTYDVNGRGLAQDLQLTAYVGNLFDQDPPFFAASPGYANGATVGRLVQIGFRKKF